MSESDPKYQFHGIHYRGTTLPLTGRLIFGVVVIVLGVLFTLDNLGLLNAGDVLRFWPVALIAYGVMRLLGIAGPTNVAGGTILTGIGTWLLLHNLQILTSDPWDFWPVIMILVGFALVTRAMKGARSPGDTQTSATISAFAMMSGTDRKILSQEFRGGDITAVMGGHQIDLRSAKLADGVAVLDLFVWWGGVDLKVPADWEVSCEGIVLMGAIEDNSKAPSGPPQGRLVLKGLVVMGGVEVKN